MNDVSQVVNSFRKESPIFESQCYDYVVKKCQDFVNVNNMSVWESGKDHKVVHTFECALLSCSRGKDVCCTQKRSKDIV